MRSMWSCTDKQAHYARHLLRNRDQRCLVSSLAFRKVFSFDSISCWNLKWGDWPLWWPGLIVCIFRHLSAHLVAAFIKKMSRLLLTAPPESLLCALPMVRNWLARHPACHVLVHRPGSIAGEVHCHSFTIVLLNIEGWCTFLTVSSICIIIWGVCNTICIAHSF